MNGIKAVLFDVNGTLVENDAVFRAVANVLSYSGVALRRAEVRAAYADLMAEQRAASGEQHPEFDVVAIWTQVLERHATERTRRLPAAKRAWLPLHLAETQRAVSRRRLRRYPYVRTVLDALAARFPLAVVTRWSCPATTGTASPTAACSTAPSPTSGWPPNTPSTSATTCTATCTAPARPG